MAVNGNEGRADEKMKIGIVTIYKCYNYGSFYQAYGLQKCLQDMGHEVYFIPTDTTYNIKYRLRRQFNSDIKRDLFSLKLCKAYFKDWRLFNIDKKNTKDFDLVIIGSDELWNIQNTSFTPSDEYYGLNLPTDNVFTYASCVGRSKVANFKNYPRLLEGIEGIKTVSVRDDETERFYKELTGVSSVPRVIDPSALIDWHKLEKSCKEQNFILVYTYDGDWGFSKEYIKATKDFAKEKGLTIISVGFKNDWCDESVACSPREFLGYLNNATYVVTDTFHGTAMSIWYKKQFISMGKGKAKVESLLSEFGLTERIFDEKHSFDRIVANDIDYKKIETLISQKKQNSFRFLLKNININ